MNLTYKCPACGNKDIKSWERYSETYFNTIGGKDCRHCGAMSRRWIGEGNGRFIWAEGFEGKTVKEVEEFFCNNVFKKKN